MSESVNNFTPRSESGKFAQSEPFDWMRVDVQWVRNNNNNNNNNNNKTQTQTKQTHSFIYGSSSSLLLDDVSVISNATEFKAIDDRPGLMNTLKQKQAQNTLSSQFFEDSDVIDSNGDDVDETESIKILNIEEGIRGENNCDLSCGSHSMTQDSIHNGISSIEFSTDHKSKVGIPMGDSWSNTDRERSSGDDSNINISSNSCDSSSGSHNMTKGIIHSGISSTQSYISHKSKVDIMDEERPLSLRGMMFNSDMLRPLPNSHNNVEDEEFYDANEELSTNSDVDSWNGKYHTFIAGPNNNFELEKGESEWRKTVRFAEDEDERLLEWFDPVDRHCNNTPNNSLQVSSSVLDIYHESMDDPFNDTDDPNNNNFSRGDLYRSLYTDEREETSHSENDPEDDENPQTTIIQDILYWVGGHAISSAIGGGSKLVSAFQKESNDQTITGADIINDCMYVTEVPANSTLNSGGGAFYTSVSSSHNATTSVASSSATSKIASASLHASELSASMSASASTTSASVSAVPSSSALALASAASSKSASSASAAALSASMATVESSAYVASASAASLKTVTSYASLASAAASSAGATAAEQVAVVVAQ